MGEDGFGIRAVTMMRHASILFSLVSISALIFTACGDDDDNGNAPGSGGTPSTGGTDGGTGGKGSGGNGGVGGEGGGGAQMEKVTLKFRAQVGDELFACGEKYADQGSSEVEVTPQDFRFYVSAVRLISSDGDEVPVTLDARSPWQSPEVALLDFEDGTGSCKNGNVQLNATITGTVPEGEYSGVVLSTAVPLDLNHADPTTLPAPLQAGGMTWGWLFGYKFIRAELLATAAPVGEAAPGAGIFHLGSTGCDNTPKGEGGEGGSGPHHSGPPTVDCGKQNRNEIRLEDFDVESDVIVADIGAMMADTDLSVASMCHSGGDSCDGYFESVGVDFASGDALENQTTFRIESE